MVTGSDGMDPRVSRMTSENGRMNGNGRGGADGIRAGGTGKASRECNAGGAPRRSAPGGMPRGRGAAIIGPGGKGTGGMAMGGIPIGGITSGG